MRYFIILLAMTILHTNITHADDASSTDVLWLESDQVSQQWQGDNLYRVVDEESGEPCLEWYQNPATRGTATLVLKDVDPSRFDAIRLQWKHLGGGAGLAITIGKRNWYLYKDIYRPDKWRDTWLDLALDDDGGGELLQPDGSLEIKLSYFNLPQNRAGEEAWRRIRLRNLRLIKFPVQLTCDPGAVTFESSDQELRTIFPMQLTNTTSEARQVELLLDPSALREFQASFAEPVVTVGANASVIVPLTFTIPAEKAASLDPLYIEEAPVYARVKGDADSLTTWYRGYVQWKPGGVIPPAAGSTPRMVDHAIRERAPALAAEFPWAKAIYDRMLDVEQALERPIVVPELRHGYSGHHVCPDHQKTVRFDQDEFKRHWCEEGQHHVEGVERLDRAAALAVHSRNSAECAALGWAWFFNRDERHARKAADLLLAYAARYPEWEYARAGATGYHSRVAHAVLGECWWIHGLTQGYDLIADAPGITEAEHRTIRERLFLTAANDIQTHRVEKNQQCEINWASGGAAINAQAWYLAALRFHGSYGLRDMVELSFSEEGFSRENEFPYHYAAMLPIVHQGVAWEALGGRFFDSRVKRIFDAPLAFSINQQLGWSGVYEVGYRFYRDPSFLSQLNRERPSREALLYGVTPIPARQADEALTNSSLLLAGKSTLRAGTPETVRAMQLSWGSPTYRGGQDMLNTLLNFRGLALNRSITRIAYGYSVPALSYHTLAGNLVQVDGLNQTGVRPEQTYLQDGPVPAARYEASLAGALYPGVRQSRSVAIAGDAFVIIDRLEADSERRFDLAWYPATDAVTISPEASFSPYPELADQGHGYGAIQDATIAPCPTQFIMDYEVKERASTLKARAHLLLDTPGELITARTHTNWHPVLTPICMIRHRGTSFTAIMVIEAGAEELPIASIERLPVSDAAAGIRITMKDGRIYEVIESGSEMSATAVN